MQICGGATAYLLRALGALCSRSPSLHIYSDDTRPETFLVFTHSLPKDASGAAPSERHPSTAEVEQFKYRAEKSPMYMTSTGSTNTALVLSHWNVFSVMNVWSLQTQLLTTTCYYYKQLYTICNLSLL